MAAKKRRSGRGKGPRQGISGNPQRRAEQLAQRRSAIADEPDLSGLRDLAYALAGGAEPSPWWDESHQRIIAAARTLAWIEGVPGWRQFYRHRSGRVRRGPGVVQAGQSSTRCSATRYAFATIVRVGLTLPLVGCSDESHTTIRFVPWTRP